MTTPLLHDQTIAVLGLGTLGRALVAGLLERGGLAPERVRATVRRAEIARSAARDLGISVGTDNAEAVAGADVVLVCTKPKGVAAALREATAGGKLASTARVVSVAAGVTTASIEAELPPGQRVVRAMPNTPCLIGEGMTVVCPGSMAGPEDSRLAMDLFRPLGRVLELDEEHIDVVTGLSGSGPAFVYVILEALSEGGVMMGLPRKVATELACQTVRGAATMVLETGRHPAELKDEVLTPAGCTIAGLLTMEDGGIRSTLARGIQEAARAAARLGKERPMSS
jgi:pyrroline-5-carboxylate reductase